MQRNSAGGLTVGGQVPLSLREGKTQGSARVEYHKGRLLRVDIQDRQSTTGKSLMLPHTERALLQGFAAAAQMDQTPVIAAGLPDKGAGT